MNLPFLMTFLLLGINSLYDLKKKEILLIPILLAGAAGALWKLAESGSVILLLLSLAPGAFLLAVSILTRGQAGAGDALLLCAAGTWSGAQSMLLCLFGALFFLSVLSVVFQLLKKPVREMPFVPFLLAGFLCQYLLFDFG